MNIKFSLQATEDLSSIHEFIAQAKTRAADNVVQRILQSIENFPLLGREGVVDGTRELSIPNLPYFTIYRIVD